MKLLSFALRLFLCTCFLLIGHTSCMKEDLSACPKPGPDPVSVAYRLSFTYVPLSVEQEEGFDPSELKTLTVYAFDSLGYFVTSVTHDEPRLADPDYGMDFLLPEGRYSFYAWGNVYDCYRFDCSGFEKGETKYEDVRLVYEGAVQDTVSVIPPPLFFSSLCDRSLTVSSTTRSSEKIINLKDTLFIVKDLYTLKIEATGLDEGNGFYRAVLTDNNACYEFDNSFASSPKVHYTSLFDYKGSEKIYSTELGTLRLSRDRRPDLKLYDCLTGQLVYQECLIDLLLAGEATQRKIDFSRMYDFVIRLGFTRDPETGIIKELRIRVNDWSVVEKDVTIDLSKPNSQ
ncbi:FimB/Mfa2 family fimbrial subunit [Massilibacteroides sp.]|uniref:FimB/Mfa2 family fimbrial subunit n=1 Tax=Massilibacteroides sp. TaxID=2034766 RepID=UPI00260C523D|nr:FimB/Mfa2 family fimbrial subunit [Massilibacteroides sp.]MDD4516877.1 FimB/Mfa2 family fimbrial subunit [Massilibacteroides sp.]